MHVVDDPAQRKAMLEGMLAWNSDFHFLYVDVNGSGLLPVEAENQGKIVITTELGGGGRVPGARAPARVERPRRTCCGTSGVLEGEVQTRASLGLPDAVILDGRDPTNYVIAEEDGPLRGAAWSPASPCAAASPSGGCGSPTSSTATPEPLVAPRDGVVASIRAIPVTEAGDSVFTIGQPIAKAIRPRC